MLLISLCLLAESSPYTLFLSSSSSLPLYPSTHQVISFIPFCIIPSRRPSRCIPLSFSLDYHLLSHCPSSSSPLTSYPLPRQAIGFIPLLIIPSLHPLSRCSPLSHPLVVFPSLSSPSASPLIFQCILFLILIFTHL
jgi:hypothetical protein